MYVYALPFIYDEKKQNNAQLRRQMYLSIGKDIGAKKINHFEYYSNFSLGITYFIVCTETPKNPYIYALWLQVYAYTKRNEEKFSYKHESLVFNDIKVLKFNVKCYGKKLSKS